jgi:hypothetical protein
MTRMFRFCLLASAAVLAGVIVWGGVAGTQSQADTNGDSKKEEKSDGPPPLVVDEDAPLLLGGSKKPVEHTGADNSDCYVCHGNLEDEPMVKWHAKEDVGCTDCHGDSFDHADDENHVIPPDIMYWPERIDPACQECHEKHDAPARAVLARWQRRCPEKTDPNKIVCTDCHGQHRLANRRSTWNKSTGEFIPQTNDVEKPEARD